MAAIAESVSSSRGALSVCPGHWLGNPYRLITVARMIELFGWHLATPWAMINDLGLGFDMGGEHAVTREEARRVLGILIALSRRLAWNDLADQTSRLLKRVESGESGEPMKVLADDLAAAFMSKANNLRLLAIEERDNALFSSATAELCGGVHLKGDLAISEEELNLAGRALAISMSTAAVFHAMRSVESSLHVLCRIMGITFSGSIEVQNWINLTEKIKSQIEGLEKQPRSDHKAERLKQFSELMIPADGFRLAWRNHVAHARERYEEEQARKILRYVGDFLKELSAAL